MKRFAAFALTVVLLASPCFAQETKEAPSKMSASKMSLSKGSQSKVEETKTKMKGAAKAPKPVKIESNKVKISPANSKISFIGTHVGPTPDPQARPGGFGKFDGAIELTEDGKSLKSFKIDIDAGSVSTVMGKLTGHLKAADFFNVEKFKKAEFSSTKIEPGSKEGTVNITGMMKMLGTEKEMVIPAVVKITDEGLVLNSTFMFDRTDHGMSKVTQKVNKKVAVSFVVGEKTMKQATSGGRGGQGRGNRGGRRR